MSMCKSCEALITWATTDTGRMMPLDSAPVPAGMWVAVSGKVRRATDEDARLHRPRYTSHFATCPGAAAHRRKP